MRRIELIVIHHSVTGPPNNEDTAKNIIRNQMQRYNKGLLLSIYSDTYHYMITQDGKQVPWVCECNVSGHCGDDEINKKSIGICLLGNFNIEKPTEIQLKTLIELLRKLYTKYKYKNILGHRDIIQTECPGNNLYSLLPMIRKEVFMEQWKIDAIKNAGNRGWIKSPEIHLNNPDRNVSIAELCAILMNFYNTLDIELLRKLIREEVKNTGIKQEVLNSLREYINKLIDCLGG